MSITSPYIDHLGNPRLRMSLTLFLDTLGTRNRSATITDSEIRKLTEAQDQYLRDLATAGVRGGMASMTFTDNLLIGTPDTSDLALMEVLLLARRYQVSMLMRGRLAVRGGVSRGPLFIGQQLAHGQGLIEAVRLEEDVARYPRVVLCDRLNDHVQELFRSGLSALLSEEVAHSLLLKDRGGVIFVDYLSGTATLGADPVSGPVSTPDILRAHSQMILDVGSNSRASAGTREKYRWLASYHSWLCEENGWRNELPPSLSGVGETFSRLFR